MSAAGESLELANRLDELKRLEPFVRDFAAGHGLSEEVVAAVRLALEEVVTNAVRHGCGDGRAHSIAVRLAHEGTHVAAVVEDDGLPFDPLSRPAAPLGGPVERQAVGGLGIWLARNVVDEVEYRRERDKNILTMRKYLPPA